MESARSRAGCMTANLGSIVEMGSSRRQSIAHIGLTLTGFPGLSTESRISSCWMASFTSLATRGVRRHPHPHSSCSPLLLSPLLPLLLTPRLPCNSGSDHGLHKLLRAAYADGPRESVVTIPNDSAPPPSVHVWTETVSRMKIWPLP